MFIHQHRLSHVLKPYHYFDAQYHQSEIARHFSSSWHVVAGKAEVPRPGDFLTTELLGRPLLVRNCGGEIGVYLNVCAHRHCQLTHQPRGHSPEFRCQYHGWQYKPDGRTARIPDAECFRPFDRRTARLLKFRSEMAGDLIFVTLDPDAPPLTEFLGEHHATASRWFAEPYRFAGRLQWDLDANWKVPAENTLEGYHLPHVHAKTLGDHPTEEATNHDVQSGYSSLYTTEPPSLNRAMQNLLIRMLGFRPTNNYTHHYIYPNTVLIGLDPTVMTQTYVPTSPTTSRWESVVYTRCPAHAWSPRAPLGWFLKRISLWALRKIVLEDVAIFNAVQRGLQSSIQPGVLGTLEERVFAFQQYLLEDATAELSLALPGKPR